MPQQNQNNINQAVQSKQMDRDGAKKNCMGKQEKYHVELSDPKGNKYCIRYFF